MNFGPSSFTEQASVALVMSKAKDIPFSTPVCFSDSDVIRKTVVAPYSNATTFQWQAYELKKAKGRCTDVHVHAYERARLRNDCCDEIDREYH